MLPITRLLGTPFTEVMTFSERFFNQAAIIATRLMYIYFFATQRKVFYDHGYNYKIEPFPQDAFYMNQCVDGVHYAVSLPPNIINTGAILPKPAKKITDESIDTFLSKFKKNIYVSQGTIVKILDFATLLEVFKKFDEIGFVVSLKKEHTSSVIALPKNVLIKEWVNQNDLLGDERIFAFITPGGNNSILESLYHA